MVQLRALGNIRCGEIAPVSVAQVTLISALDSAPFII